MNLPRPGQSYDQGNEANARSVLEAADGKNMKVGAIFDKLMMRDTVTGGVVTLTIASGALVIT